MTRDKGGPAAPRGVRVTVWALMLILLGSFMPAVTASAAPALPTVTAFTPQAGSTAGGGPVTLRGRGLSKASEVRFGGVAGKVISSSATHLTVRTPKHGAGTVAVQVVTPAGTSAVSASAQYTFTAAPPALEWSPATAVDPSSGDDPAKSVSCLSARFCMAVNDNHVSRFDGHTWQPPVHLGSASLELSSVSCASTTLCLAVGTAPATGRVYVYNGKFWNTTAEKSRAGLYAVSCVVGTTYCLSVGTAELSYDAGTWQTVRAPKNTRPEAVSCVSRAFCMVTGFNQGFIYDAKSHKTSKPVGVDVGVLHSYISCVSTKFCLMSGGAGKWSVYDGTRWSASKAIAKGFVPTGLSCVATTYCLAADGATHRTERFNGHSWSTAPTVSEPNADLEALSCWSGAHCVTVDAVGNAYLRNGSDWSGATRVLPYAGSLTDVSCASTTDCIAVDASGNALKYDGRTWSAPSNVANAVPLAAVSCPSTTYCVAVDGRPLPPLNGDPNRTVLTARTRGRAYVYNGSSWKAGALIDTAAWMSDVSCASSAFCVAVDNKGNELTYRSGTWSKPRSIDAHGELSSVDCPTITFCVAVSLKGYVTYLTGGSWTTPRKIAGRSYLTDVSCITASYCAIADLDGVEVRTGSLLGPALKGFDEEEGYSSVSCVSSRFCLAGTQNADDDEGDQGGETYSFDGSARANARASVYSPKLSCVTSTFCVGVEADYDSAAVGVG